MAKRDFHGIKITGEVIALSKNEKINKAVSKLFNNIKSDKIEKIIQAVLSYRDVGLVVGCLKYNILYNRDIEKNSKCFYISENMLITYIDISKECSDKVIKTISDCINETISKSNSDGGIND